MAVTVSSCSSDDEDDIYYIAEVLTFDSSQLYGRAKIIHSAKDDELSGRLVKDAQFIFCLKDNSSHDIAESDIITFKALKIIIPDYITTGLFDIVETEITKIERK